MKREIMSSLTFEVNEVDVTLSGSNFELLFYYDDNSIIMRNTKTQEEIATIFLKNIDLKKLSENI